MSRSARTAIVVLGLGGFTLSLYHDCELLAWRRGEGRLRAGDYRGALEFLPATPRVANISPAVALDAGIALYRLGDFGAARQRFAAAGAVAEPRFSSAAFYNQGNCAFRLAEQAGKKDPKAAERLLRESAGHYLEALARTPDAGDARHNLAVVQGRLAELSQTGLKAAAAAAAAGKGGATSSEKGQDPQAPGGAGQGESARPSESPFKAGSQGYGEQAGTRDGGPQKARQRAGKAVPELTRDRAVGVLDEARGREVRSVGSRSKGEASRPVRPERDW